MVRTGYCGGSTIRGNNVFPFDSETAESVTDGLFLENAHDYYQFVFKFHIASEPPIYEPFTIRSPVVKVGAAR